VGLARRIRVLRGEGYCVHVPYLHLRSPDLAVARVEDRVRRGGHAVPPGTVRRRYERSLNNYFRLYVPLADAWRFYDNSDIGSVRLVATGGRDFPERVFGDQTWRAARSRE